MKSQIVYSALLAMAVFVVQGCSSPRSRPSIARLPKSSQPSSPQAPKPSGGGYYMDDGPMAEAPANLDLVPDALPALEPLAKFANRPYNVFGIDYQPQTDLNQPYRQVGIASWYGRKFHGQKTSSGEIYDMFAMTAAHPTLPIPSYARVSNPKNGKSVIVRVNDRGPFLHGRLIDLSYTAAYKLGYVNQGSAELEVEKLTPELIAMLRAGNTMVASNRNVVPLAKSNVPVMPIALAASEATPVAVSMPVSIPDPISAIALAPADEAINPAPVLNAESNRVLSPTPINQAAQGATAAPGALDTKGYFLQLGAFGSRDNAENLLRRINSEPTAAVSNLQVVQAKSLYKLIAGPFSVKSDAQAAAQKLQMLIALEPVLIQQ